MSFISVTDITNMRPTQATVGTEVELLADVVPSNATNRVIEWSRVSGVSVSFRTTGAGATYRTFMTFNESGTVTLRATIRNGAQG